MAGRRFRPLPLDEFETNFFTVRKIGDSIRHKISKCKKNFAVILAKIFLTQKIECAILGILFALHTV